MQCIALANPRMARRVPRSNNVVAETSWSRQVQLSSHWPLSSETGGRRMLQVGSTVQVPSLHKSMVLCPAFLSKRQSRFLLFTELLAPLPFIWSPPQVHTVHFYSVTTSCFLLSPHSESPIQRPDWIQKKIVWMPPKPQVSRKKTVQFASHVRQLPSPLAM